MSYKDPLQAEKLSLLATEQNRILDIVLTHTELERHCPLDNGRHDGVALSSQNIDPTLGNLDMLPLELCTDILLGLDLQSLTQFRTINRRARFVVDNLPQYRDVITHAPGLIRAALSIQIAPWLSCRALYSALHTKTCSICGDVGAFIYMFTGRRVCYICVMEQPQFLPLTQSHAKHSYGLNRKALSLVPKILKVPGSYTCFGRKSRTREFLFDRQCARQAGIMLHGSAHKMEEYVFDKRAKAEAKHEEKFRRQVESPHTVTSILSIPPPRFMDEPNPRRDRYLRFVGIIRAPWVNRDTKAREWGLSCIGCRKNDRIDNIPRHLDRRRIYTSNGYLAHFEECTQSQQAWDLYLDHDTIP